MFIGEGADQLREFATRLLKVDPKPATGQPTAYKQGYMQAVSDIVRDLRTEARKLDHARMKANSGQQE